MPVRTVAAVPGVPDHPTVRLGRIGVLLVNLGTPDSTSIPDIRRYLAEFLSDRRVIDVNPVLWKLILHGVILRTRPPKTAEAYRAIWLAETDESPLRYHTRATAEALQARLDPGAETVRVDWAMRYGNPAIRDRMEALQDEGCDRILVLPLYPQYAASTTATVVDEVARHLLDARWQPAVRTVPAFHDDPAYIEAVAAGVETHLGTLDWQPEVILASFHGLPKRYLTLGDPYRPAAAHPARPRRKPAAADLPVAVRARGVAAALHRRDHRDPGAVRGEAAGRGDAGLRRRLCRDPGGDRHSGPRDLRGRRRHPLHGDPLPELQRRRRGALRHPGPPRAGRLVEGRGGRVTDGRYLRNLALRLP